jgi:hypothetical protein
MANDWLEDDAPRTSGTLNGEGRRMGRASTIKQQTTAKEYKASISLDKQRERERDGFGSEKEGH